MLNHYIIALKCYQYLGSPIKADKVDVSIKKYIAAIIGVDSKLDLKNYNKKTRKRHIKIIREYLKLNANKPDRRKIMKATALNAASTKENLADIINAVIDELIKSKFELPSFKRLVRLARAARTLVNNDNYMEIVSKLTDEQKQLIDTMIDLIIAEDKDLDYLSWVALKQEPKKPTTNNIKQ
ncbi:MAG: DUF4158 domain-containing protein [Gammaproteobacteria bacterium]|nr:DUF4158 domain-containing protein [Gammaproteobacteria bacterium]MCW5584131.1 DUF4158 domain-containing protein [Gammaproteobacteria bacterium]